MAVVVAVAVTVSLGAVTFFALGLQDLARLDGIKERIRQDFPDVRSIGTDALHHRLQSGAMPLLLDVRRVEEYQVSRIPGALRLDPTATARDLDDPSSPVHRIAKDREIVVYCSVGYRSARLARRLSEAGFTRVKNLEGSIFEWAQKGYPLRQGDLKVFRVHPYSRAWAYLVPEPLRAFTPEEARRP